mmetsp:Transcript_50273/g.92906  ORF Transcript_50273/g.92906 Transcript_50273/m.92906 type:complete len:427 (+) Transcript_50273:84-1364(+)
MSVRICIAVVAFASAVGSEAIATSSESKDTGAREPVRYDTHLAVTEDGGWSSYLRREPMQLMETWGSKITAMVTADAELALDVLSGRNMDIVEPALRDHTINYVKPALHDHTVDNVKPAMRELDLADVEPALRDDDMENAEPALHDADMAATMSVFVFSARHNNISRRDAVRRVWTQVDQPRGQVCMRFAMCNSPSDEHTDALAAEQAKFADLLLLDCEEGYFHGLLTKKLIAAMKYYVHSSSNPCMNRQLFMKVDDDTFVSGHNFRRSLHDVLLQHPDSLYAGVFAEKGPPHRNPASKYYEPVSAWPTDYPPAMYGGPGYLLGRSLVEHIVTSGVAEKHILFGEDRAVGVWISELEQTGVGVNWLHMRGNNGFMLDPYHNTGAWEKYPYAMLHELSEFSIACLADLEEKKDPRLPVDGCFPRKAR